MMTRINLALAAGSAVCLASATPAMAERTGGEALPPRGDLFSTVHVLDQEEIDIVHVARSASYSFNPFNLLVGGMPSTMILDVSGVPAGAYASFSMTVDWSPIAGDPWSNQAQFGLWDTNAADFLNTSFVPNNGASSGSPITLNWSGSFAFNYNGGDPLEFHALQSFVGSSANWNNINLTLHVVPTPGALAIFGFAGLAAVRRRR